MKNPLLEVKSVSKSLREGERSFKVLNKINFEIAQHEFVCMLGPSGCGKTLLLEIITGLEKPDSGEVLFEKQVITPENPRVANVFQHFALLPWLNVRENIEVVLEAQGLNEKERRKLAKKYLKLVGIIGVSEAYPRELSAGMKQRVGIARALATEPVLLCLDEPFSALDPLTGEAIKEELMQLWQSPEFPTQSVLLVTNDPEDAVYMADKIIILTDKPAKIKAVLNVRLPRPRDVKSKDFYSWVDKIYSLMT